MKAQSKSQGGSTKGGLDSKRWARKLGSIAANKLLCCKKMVKIKETYEHPTKNAL